MILITGGAGFIGRWVVKEFLDRDYHVICLDNLSNGSLENIEEFLGNEKFKFIRGDIRNKENLNFRDIELCIHLAAQINVQESIDHPDRAYENNILGTYNILEFCRKNDVKLSLVSTCMVYDVANIKEPINEEHKTLPRSPYAASKLAAEELAIGYMHAYGLKLVITRPFNTYGPFQKTNMEGGVVAVFIKRKLEGKDLLVFGDGTQTRDFLYVTDCSRFIYLASIEKKAEGEIINAGYGEDISINGLAKLISQGKVNIRHVPHHHPQAEIKKLICDYSKAKKLLNWKPKVNLEEGLKKTEEWISERCF